jgi:hypothetical protein
MNLPNPAPLIFFRVVADRAGKPSGLLVEIGAGDPVVVLPLLARDSFDAGGQWPCLFRDGLDPAQAEALQQAGWNRIKPGTLFRADDRLVTQFLPPEAVWIDGDWCMAPPAKALGQQAASRTLALQLVQLVADDADTHAIEALLRRDPTLSYNLLRLVNSLGMGVGRRITSFSQALLILGRQQLRRWLNLMLFAARQSELRSAMLLARVAQRARALELLAKSRGLDRTMQEQCFMVGMFSLLGVLFGMPLAELLAPLSISESVQDALLRQQGELGALLKLFETAERGDFDSVGAQLAALQLTAQEFNQAMVAATGWMLAAVGDSQGAAHG